MKKRCRIISSVLAVCLLTTVVGSSGTSANNLKDLQNEKKAAENKKNSLNSTIQQKEIQIEAKRSKADQLIKQVKLLNEKIEETNANMDRIIAEMNETKREINVLQESIKELEDRIAERDEVLRERIRVMQVKGGKVSYIDVLLGANSFSDFIDRFSAVTTLMDADRKILEQQEADMAKLEEEKALVEQKLAEQEQRKLKIQAMKDELVEKKLEKRELVRNLEEEQEKLSGEKTSLEEEYDDAIKISKKLEAKIVAEQERLAEIARKEQARKLALSEDMSIPASELPVISSGFWTTPTKGKYSSGFGLRTHPITKVKRQHRGIDISAPMGTPVVAAGDGVVSYAGNMSGFGNIIMITHSVKGQILTTVYAHLSTIGTSSGAHVGKGELIGAVGSTGLSTGPHLHFEVHVGNFSATGPSAVNPLHYVGF
ncbi:peptidoglycan DD-metalloendopeptidase family protein [Sporosarcina sp. GW1-11]|uniref:murein hydrolase activator EnvC family protein n=1 Tax=Sporosarcina sp. GW1-11 TaxID=2899126 RepID=UPI00294F1313|nr:peptidoglycan DD-metalloendopeptidase family protein [Sporosarcina sp. GW1-11]MDV6376940.1 peptidoglycan DD-metalloendopeptidase family protein [Sporosarcina sp. GW1-11]